MMTLFSNSVKDNFETHRLAAGSHARKSFSSLGVFQIAAGVHSPKEISVPLKNFESII